VELQVVLDRQAPRSLQGQLESQLRAAILGNRLAPGTRLPPSRVLAAQLNIARGVVVGAYGSLVDSGYLISRQGAGTVVAGATLPDESDIDFTPRDRPEPADCRWDLRAGWPDLAGFPRGDWLAATERVLRAMPHSGWGYNDPRGAPELRSALANRLARTRGIAPAPARLLITTGSRQAHQLAFRLLRARGARRIAVEDPGWYVQRLAAEDAELEAVPVPVDADGLQVEVLVGLDVDAAVLTPAHQFPLGVALTPARRAALLAWADRHEAFVIEDDYDAEFRYDGRPIPALHAEAPQRVISIGSLSKTFAPALRMGWMALPAELALPAARAKERMDNGSPWLEQLVVAELENSGRMNRHLRRTARRYASRRNALVTALATELPEVQVRGMASGLHLVAELPPTLDEAAVLAAARARSISIQGVTQMRLATPPGPPSLLIGYSNLPEALTPRVIRELAEAVAETKAREQPAARPLPSGPARV
jgi:GntR family transcriptional regulator/MocR family aminotransferase